MPESTEPITVESAMEQNASIFEGHPAEGEIEVKPDESVENDENRDEKPEIKPEEKPDEPERKPAFKYVSQEAAEVAYKEAESLIGKKAEEAKRERERAEDLQKQLNDALLKVTKTEPEPTKPTTEDYVEKLLGEVGGFDPDDPDYYKKTAKSWATIFDKIKTEANADAIAFFQEKMDAFKEEQAQVNDELSKQKTIITDAERAGKEAGLDMKKGSDDSEMFWAFADRAPEGSIEDQIKWTVDKVKGIKDGIAAPLLKAGDKAKETQNQNAVLERGGHKPAEKAVPVNPLGLADAFTQIQRRI